MTLQHVDPKIRDKLLYTHNIMILKIFNSDIVIPANTQLYSIISNYPNPASNQRSCGTFGISVETPFIYNAPWYFIHSIYIFTKFKTTACILQFGLSDSFLLNTLIILIKLFYRQWYIVPTSSNERAYNVSLFHDWWVPITWIRGDFVHSKGVCIFLILISNVWNDISNLCECTAPPQFYILILACIVDLDLNKLLNRGTQSEKFSIIPSTCIH